MSPRASSCIVLLLVVGACADSGPPTALQRLAGNGVTTWVLRSVDGEAVPTVVVDNHFVRTTVLADTIRLAADGIGERRLAEHTVSFRALPPGEATYRRTERFTYTVEDGTFSAEVPCPEFAGCIAPPHLVGTLSGDVLVLERAHYRAPLRYERVTR